MKNKIILVSDRITEYFLYLLIFFVSFSQAGVEVCFAFAFSAWIIKRVLNCKAKGLSDFLPSSGINKPLLAFILANLIAVIVSVNFKASLRPFFSKVLEYIIIFFMVADTINTKKRIRNLLIVIVFSAVLISLDAGVQYFRGVDFLRGYIMGGQGHNRLRASFIGPNDFACWLITVICILTGLLLSRYLMRSLVKRLGLSILIFCLLICIGLTYSRAAWLGLAVGLMIIAWYRIKRLSKRTRVLSVLLISVLIVGTFSFLPVRMKERAGYINSSRFLRWGQGLSMLKDYPVFGTGLSTYMQISSKYPIMVRGQGEFYPHNSYLHMAVETGLLGLLCFLLILVSGYRLIIKALRKTDNPLLLGLMGGISAFLVHSFFETNLYSLQLAVLFWFMFGLALAIVNLLNREVRIDT
jgi:O-antigen ligase